MSDFYPWGLYDFRPKKLPPSAALDNVDIQHYKTAAELIQQEDLARARQISLSESYVSAGPEERRAIDIETERLGARIVLLHRMAKERNEAEFENLLRPLREWEAKHPSGEDEMDSLQSSEESELASNNEYLVRVRTESDVMRRKITDGLLAKKTVEASKRRSAERGLKKSAPSGFKTSSLIIGSGVTVALIALMGWVWSRFKKRQSPTTDRRSRSREWSASESS
jgi:hypothetical protein